jgi:hypothetical protein
VRKYRVAKPQLFPVPGVGSVASAWANPTAAPLFELSVCRGRSAGPSRPFAGMGISKLNTRRTGSEEGIDSGGAVPLGRPSPMVGSGGATVIVVVTPLSPTVTIDRGGAGAVRVGLGGTGVNVVWGGGVGKEVRVPEAVPAVGLALDASWVGEAVLFWT